MARASNPSVTRKSSAAKKLATFAADVSDQREMDQGVHVPNSTEGAHHLRRWAFLWRYVVHNKKIRFTRHLLDLHWRSRAPELVFYIGLDRSQDRAPRQSNNITARVFVAKLSSLGI